MILHLSNHQIFSFPWRHPIAASLPVYLPSITCFRRQFLRKMWPIQLAFIRFTVCTWLYVILPGLCTERFPVSWKHWRRDTSGMIMWRNPRNVYEQTLILFISYWNGTSSVLCDCIGFHSCAWVLCCFGDMAQRLLAIGTRSFGKTVSTLRKPTPCTRRTATSWVVFLRQVSGLFGPLHGQSEFLVSCRFELLCQNYK